MQTTPQPAATPPVASDLPLTIDKHNLSGWLKDCRDQIAAIKYMDGLCHRAYPKPHYDHLNYARATLKISHEDTVTAITRMGGLLLIGGAV